MRTPAGKECPYFYGDYRRGRNREECRLLQESNPPQRWTRDLCGKCPVPDIVRANACPNIILEGRVKRTFLGLIRRVEVAAYCKKVLQPVADPYVGCGECHPMPSIFFQEPDEPDAAARP